MTTAETPQVPNVAPVVPPVPSVESAQSIMEAAQIPIPTVSQSVPEVAPAVAEAVVPEVASEATAPIPSVDTITAAPEVTPVAATPAAPSIAPAAIAEPSIAPATVGPMIAPAAPKVETPKVEKPKAEKPKVEKAPKATPAPTPAVNPITTLIAKMATLEKVENGVRVPTIILQNLVSKVIKCAGMIPNLTITSLIDIKSTNNVITLSTTDEANHLTVKKAGIPNNDYEVLVDAKTFAQLVSKITTDFVTISTTDSNIVVKGNGTYNLPIIKEEDGSAIQFPTYEFDTSLPSVKITDAQVKSLLSISKASVAASKEVPSLFNYYFDADGVMTTDTYKCCLNPIKAVETPTCLPQTLVELMLVVADEGGVTVQQNDHYVLISSASASLYGPKASEEDTKKYPAEVFKKLCASAFPYSCKINRTQILNALDRLSLFAEAFDKNSVQASFAKDSVDIASKSSKSHEVIKYLSSGYNEDVPCTYLLDVSMLKQLLSTGVREDVEIKFGNAEVIQLNVNETNQILATLEDTVEEEAAEAIPAE